MTSADHEVLAVRYGYSQTTRGDCFYRYASYGEPDGEIAMDFYFWVIRDGSKTYLVDTGASQAAIAKRPGRTRIRGARAALEALTIDPESVTDVILTHLHYDHTGHLCEFPDARLHLQQAEFEFWTGPHARQPPQLSLQEPGDIRHVARRLEQRQGSLVDGDAEVLPGVRMLRVGGHTPGQSIVVVENQQTIILASDAVHYYGELDLDRPYGIFFDLGEMYAGYAKIRELESREHAVVVAGHDPLVTERFPTVLAEQDGLAAVRVSG